MRYITSEASKSRMTMCELLHNQKVSHEYYNKYCAILNQQNLLHASYEKYPQFKIEYFFMCRYRF